MHSSINEMLNLSRDLSAVKVERFHHHRFSNFRIIPTRYQAAATSFYLMRQNKDVFDIFEILTKFKKNTYLKREKSAFFVNFHKKLKMQTRLYFVAYCCTSLEIRKLFWHCSMFQPIQNLTRLTSNLRQVF